MEPLPAPRPGAYSIRPDTLWTDRAASWPVYVDEDLTEPGHWHTDVVHPALAGKSVGQFHLRCGRCGQSVLCLSPDTAGESYRVTVADMLSGIVAHLHRSHEDVVAS